MKLHEVCELIADCPHSTAKDEGNGYALIRTPNIGRGRLELKGVHRVSKDIYDLRNLRAIPQTDDLILAREAPVGNVAKILEGQKVCLGQRTVLIRPDKSKVSPDFLTYYLLAPEQQHNLTSYANGATVAHLNMGNIRNLAINLPTRQVQNRIASILSAYDDMIDNCKRQIALLEEAAQRLYREWFVNNKTNGILSDLAIDAGVSTKKSDRDKFECYTPIDCLTRKSLAYYSSKDISLAESSLKSYKPKDILFGAMRVYFHKVCIAQEMGLTRSTCIAINAKEHNYWAYLVLLLFSEDTIAWATANSKDGTTMPYISWDKLKQMPIFVPIDKDAEKFNNIVEPYLSKIIVLAKYMRKLIKIKDTLLPRLISGQIEIKV